MPALLACPVRLAAAQRHRLKKTACGHKSPYRDKLRAQIVLDAARGHNNARIARARHVTEDTVRKWRGRFADEGLAGLADREPGPGDRPGSPRCRWPRSRRWPANCPPRPARRCHIGPAPSWPTRPHCVASSNPSPRPRSGVGWPTTPSSPGSTGPGSPSGIPTSGPRRPGSSTSTSGCGTANRSARTSTSSPATRSPPSRPAAAAIPPCHQARAGRCASSTNTTGAEH